MPKIRLTKNELKTQKEALKRYVRYLPTLILKKTQLIQEIKSITRTIDAVDAEIAALEKTTAEWADVFAESVDLTNWLRVQEIKTGVGNIAGIDIRLFQDVVFEELPYDFFATPLWVDSALSIVKEQIARKIRIKILEEQIETLKNELRITVQRINLFEKVKIPEAKENIRVIQIFLGDAQTAEVVRGKIAKSKIQKKREASAA
ncbi:MAG: V-type ATP synthase subunit D [Candidatus Marinimicrobia bacterium CG08_land_8_20_14_0_20_45_22]|nr:MAG: V-type ATP synthase subunit D [Candidatus Marinimicrobia bacterium CG08_land_8_20_14_0_20_45_22]